MKWIIFRLKKLFAKENAGCFNCKWHIKDIPGVWMSEECHHKDNLYKYTQTDYRTGKKHEIKRWIKKPYELNYEVDCPWFERKVEPSFYGSGKMEEDLKRAFVPIGIRIHAGNTINPFTSDKKTKKRGKKK